MKRRYRNQPPPDDAEYVVGEGFEFKPEHDRVNAGKPLPPPVELTPVGPAPTVYEYRPEHDTVRPTSGASPAPRAASSEATVPDPSRAALVRYFEAGGNVQSQLRETCEADEESFPWGLPEIPGVAVGEDGLLWLLRALHDEGVIDQEVTLAAWDTVTYVVVWRRRV